MKEQKQMQEGQGRQGGQGKSLMRGKGKRKVDLSKDDYFMAIAKLATSQSTTKTKVQSLN